MHRLLRFSLVLCPTILFNWTTLYYISQKSSFVIYAVMLLLEIVTLITLVMTSVMDPGYIPRRNFIKAIKTDKSESTIEDQAAPFFNQYVYDKGRIVKMKYWYTWEIYRPQRSSHWGNWDAWIEKIDHHWPWLGTWIGKRNYKYFFIFVNWLSFMVFLGIFLSTIEIILRVSDKKAEGLNTNEAMKESLKISPYPIIFIALSIISSLFVVVLCLYHHKLAWISSTTYEELKGITIQFYK